MRMTGGTARFLSLWPAVTISIRRRRFSRCRWQWDTRPRAERDEFPETNPALQAAFAAFAASAASAAARSWLSFSRASTHRLCASTAQPTATARPAKPFARPGLPAKTFLKIAMRAFHGSLVSGVIGTPAVYYIL